MTIHDDNQGNKIHEFFEDDDQTVPLQMKLDLEELPPLEFQQQQQQELRQSPASALPPYEENLKKETTYVITPEHIRKPRGEYIPLNPDINKANPPRKGASKIFSDPFNVSDAEAPPVTSELLSPSHVFSSLEDLNSQFSQAEWAMGFLSIDNDHKMLGLGPVFIKLASKVAHFKFKIR